MLSSINTKATPLSWKKIQIVSEGTQVTLNRPSDLKTYERKPEVGYEFTYSYYNNEGIISEVSLRFSDYSRKLTVEGSDPNHVDAIFTMLKEQIEKRQTLFGGSSLRGIGGLVLGIMASLFLLLGIEIPLRIDLRDRIFLIMIGTIIIILLLSLPFKNWLPGFAVYSGDASWVVRNSAQITFFGVIISIAIPLAVPLIRWIRTKPTRNSASESEKVDSNN